MKKFITLIPFLLVFLSKTYSQDSMSFEIRYLPNHRYNQTVRQMFHIEMKYMGDDTVMNVLKEKGISNPVITDRETNLQAVATTGSLNYENKMPIELQFLKADDQQGNAVIPAGTRMLGTVPSNDLPRFDSIISENMEENQKKIFLNAFRNILAQVTLPAKRMTKGDEFTQTTPVSFPIGFATINMGIAITYKLASFSDSLAQFDIAIKCSIKMNNDEVPVSGGGEGTGIMTFDRINQFPLRYDLSYTMDVDAVKDPIRVHAVLKSTAEHQYQISKN